MSETKCECPARQALEDVLRYLPLGATRTIFFDSDDNGTAIEHQWYINAKAALSAPCPCEGLREDTGHGEICYYCQKPCNGAAANPMKWPIPLCHPDEPGVPKWHHIGCVSERLAERDQLYATLCRKIEAYSDPWREREQLRAELAEALEANKTQPRNTG